MKTRDGRDLFDEAFAVRATLDSARDAAAMAEVERNNLISRSYEDGISAVELAEFFGISRQRVHRIANNVIEANQRAMNQK